MRRHPVGERSGTAGNLEGPSTRYPGLQIEDHVPQAVDLPAFDDLERLEAAERFVRRVQPRRDHLGRHDLGEAVAESVELPDPAEARLAHGLAPLPIGDRAFRETGEPGEELAA